jgi:hypothetical protein
MSHANNSYKIPVSHLCHRYDASAGFANTTEVSI